MPSAVTTQVTELPESRVRVDAEVAPEELEKRVQVAARQIGRDLRIPGFRKGKVPAPVIIQRVGRQAVLDEAVRDSMGQWYAAAIEESGIVPVGDPELDLGDVPEQQGHPLRFSIEVGVRPTAQLGEYKGLEVGRREPHVDDAAVEAELDSLRERVARLETVDRPAQRGDFVVMDFAGKVDGEPFPGGEGRDQMVELGSGRLVGSFEDQLQGASAGEERTVEITFPDDYGAQQLAGRPAQFSVTVKEVKEKQLPPLDDDLASDAAGFDTLDELRDDIRSRLAGTQAEQIEREYREAVVEAATRTATIEVPERLVEARAHDLWHDMEHSLRHQGIAKDLYLRISGKTEEQVVEDAKPDAERALRQEAVLAAVVEAEGIAVTDEEILEAVVPEEERARVKKPEKLLNRLRDAGRLESLRADLAQRKAVDLLAEQAKPIPVADARARNLPYTPEPGEGEGAEQGSGAASGAPQIWTPGS